MRKVILITMVVLLSFVINSIMPTSSLAVDFLEKRKCVLQLPGKAPIHTKCIISGGMQGGTIDISAKTPDGRKYAIEGPVDRAEGKKYLLQNAPAHVRKDGCFQRNDNRLAICLEEEID